MIMNDTTRNIGCSLTMLPFLLGVFAASEASAAVFKTDFNGDGYEDLAVASPGKDIGGVNAAGEVTVIYGTASGINGNRQAWNQNTALGDTPEQYDSFGTVLAVGDFDGNGYDDLAVGVPNEDFPGKSGAGAVHVIYGYGSGLQA